MSMFSFHKKTSLSQWLLLSSGILALHFLFGLLIVMAANGNMLNHVLTPIFQYIGVFKLTWPEQPLGSLHFLATKPILVLSHYDDRSALNLWTLEYDFYTLTVYLAVSLGLGRVLANHRRDSAKVPFRTVIVLYFSAFLISFSMSYMTVLEHCSGATWAGFVTLYGLGLSEFQLYPIYQIICILIGILGFAGSLIWLNTSRNRAFS